MSPSPIAVIAGLAIVAASPALAATPDTFATSAGQLQITPIMHASLMIQAGGKIIYVDPAMGRYSGLPPADCILITHAHADHFAPATIAKLKKPGTIIVAPRAAADQMAGVTNVLSNGQMLTLGAFKIEAIPMYNLSPGPQGTIFHPRGVGNGYVLTYGGKRFYFSGDTSATPEMKALRHIDVAFVCMNLPYTMSPQEAADGVKAFHPAIVYPYHYRGNPPTDLNIFVKALRGSGIEVRLRDWYPKG